MKRALALLLLVSTLVLPNLGRASTAEDSLRVADVELNRTYQELLKALPTPESQAQLREAQRGWLAFKEAEFSFRASLPKVSGNGLKITELEMTDSRTAQLKEVLESLAD